MCERKCVHPQFVVRCVFLYSVCPGVAAHVFHASFRNSECIGFLMTAVIEMLADCA